MPTVSVLLPAYNAGEYILEAMRSILSQTFSDFELLVLLDPSSDDTEEKVRSLSDNRIRIVASTERRGLSGSLNRGISLARGAYVARMDADDISHPRRLAAQVRFLERRSDYIGCGTWMRIYGQRDLIRHEHDPDRLRARLLFDTQFAHPSVVIRTEYLKRQDLQYDERAKFGEDYDLWIRLIRLGKFTNIRMPLVRYRHHPRSLSVHNTYLEVQSLAALRRKALALIDLHPTNREMEAHCSLANAGISEPTVAREELLAWSRKVEDANETAGYASPRAMASVLRERLWKIDSHHGMFPYLKHQALRIGQVYLSPR